MNKQLASNNMTNIEKLAHNTLKVTTNLTIPYNSIRTLHQIQNKEFFVLEKDFTMMEPLLIILLCIMLMVIGNGHDHELFFYSDHSYSCFF